MTRDDILEAAALIFSQKGYHAASMQDIADRVNLQKASLYYHFSKKQVILLALLERALDLLIQRMEEVLAKPLPPDEKLRQAMRAYLQAMLDHRELAAVLLLEHRSLDPEVRNKHILRRDHFEGLWRLLITDGIDQGHFTNSEPALAARYLLGVMNWTITWYKPNGRLSPEAIADQFAELILQGLYTR